MFSPLDKQQEHKLLSVECQQEGFFRNALSQQVLPEAGHLRGFLLVLDTFLLRTPAQNTS
jgi:hypothetical protein